jgi:hypothetical protein
MADDTYNGFPVKRLCDITYSTGPKWLIEGLIPARSTILLGGDSSVGKSCFNLYNAIHIASGLPLYGTYPTVKGKVLWFNAEDSQEETLERAEVICQYLNIDVPDDIILLDISELLLDQAINIQKLTDTVAHHKPSLVIIDPLRNLHTQEENDSLITPAVLQPLRVIQRDHDCSIIVSHHTNKSKNNSGQNRFRGSNAVIAWCDLGILLERTNNITDVKFIKKKSISAKLDDFQLEYQSAGTGLSYTVVPNAWGRELKPFNLLDELTLQKNAGNSFRAAMKYVRVTLNRSCAQGKASKLWQDIGGAAPTEAPTDKPTTLIEPDKIARKPISAASDFNNNGHTKKDDVN